MFYSLEQTQIYITFMQGLNKAELQLALYI